MLSALVSALPVLVLLSGIGIFRMRAHVAALAGLATALVIAVFGFHMPVTLAGWAALYGAAYGLLPIGWIILNIIFLYKLTNERGQFDILRDSIARVTDDSRLQLLLIAFCFGAFFEGAAGFGSPVAVTGAMLIGLGFTRLQASGLSLIANTAPVAFGALGTPIVVLGVSTGLPLDQLSTMVGRQMFPFAILVPFWLLWAYCGWRRTLDISIKHGIAAPAYSASLAYYDALRRARLPGNVIQAQRDFFGGHTYLRTDKQGTYHMEWKEGGTEILQVEGKSRTK